MASKTILKAQAVHSLVEGFNKTYAASEALNALRSNPPYGWISAMPGALGFEEKIPDSLDHRVRTTDLGQRFERVTKLLDDAQIELREIIGSLPL